MFFVLRFMASNCSDQNARYAILLQRGTMAEYENIVLSWPSEEAPPVIKGSLDANEDIGVVEVIRTIDDVFDIGESNVESTDVRSEFSKFSENKESVKEVVVGGGEVYGRLDEINLNVSDELADNGVGPIPTSLVAHESPRVRQLWERIGTGDAHRLMDNGRNHKFIQPNVLGWMPDSQSAYYAYHLEGKVQATTQSVGTSKGFDLVFMGVDFEVYEGAMSGGAARLNKKLGSIMDANPSILVKGVSGYESTLSSSMLLPHGCPWT
nr:hypothetical protein [Tanacetum cinerariifolium]